jgi:PAS domain S-box-containing protein
MEKTTANHSADQAPADTIIEQTLSREDRFRALVQNLSDMIMILDEKGLVSYESPSWSRTMGYPEGHLIGKSPFSYIHPEDINLVLKDFQDAIAGNIDGIPTPFRYLKNDGTWALIEALGDNLIDNPAIRGVVITAREVTERMRAQEELREIEERYRLLMNATRDVIYTVSPELTMLSVSPSIEGVLGYKPDEVIGRSVLEVNIIHPEDNAKAVAEIEKLFTGKSVGPTEFRIVTNDGSIKIAEIVGTPLIRNDEVIGFTSIARDVTEKKRAEEALRKSEEKYRTIIENIDSGYFEVDLRGNIKYFNPALMNYLGYEVTDLKNLNYRDFMDKDEAGKVFNVFAEVYQTGNPKANFYWNYYMKDGTKASSVTSVFPIRNDEGEIIGFRGTARDITELKEIEEALRDREETFRALAENTLDTIMRFDREYRHLYVNPIVEKQTGIPQDQFIGKTHEELGFPGELVKIWDAAIKHVFDSSKPHRIEFQLPDKSWLDWLLVPEYDEQGGVKAVITSARDITEQKRTQQTLQESERRLANIIDFLPDATMVIDREEKVIAWNRAMEKMTGVRPEDMIGKGEYEYAIPFYGEKRPILVDLALKQDESVEEKYAGVSRDGELIYGEANIKTMQPKEVILWGVAAPLRNFEGEIVGAIESIRDITDRKRVEKELQMAKEAADIASRAKGEFLANMSHEIRTPLNAIIGLSELAMEMDLDDEKIGVFQTINDEAEHLLALVNDILDFSKIEAGRVEVEEIPFDLAYLMDNIMSSFAYRAEQKGLELFSYISADTPLSIIGDPGRLRQVLVNLVGNALKFTHEGRVYVNVQRQCDLGKQVVVRFSIEDTGIGIPEDKQSTIFESFTQADGSTTRKYGGSGLGTTISKNLVELMGGSIGISSKLNKGSIFWFDVPFTEQLEQGVIKPQAAIDLQGLRVMVVDDEPTNRWIIQEYLKSWGCPTTEASGGEEALSILKDSVKHDKRPQIIITDFQMPEMDGFGFVRELKKDANLSLIPVIMLTSIARIGDGKYCRDLGIAGYLTKPIKKMDLYRVICSVISSVEGAKTSPEKVLITRHTVAEKSRKKIRILVAEDYPTNRRIAVNHITKAGYLVEAVENGRQAVDAWKSKDYDLILMDVQMPEMDGYEATAAIREIEASYTETKDMLPRARKRVPIIAMTAHAMQEYLDRCIAAGMDDYLTKPLKRQIFLDIIEKWTVQNAVSDEMIRDVGETMNVNFQETFNYQRALAEFGGDGGFLADVAGEFVSNVQSQLEVIRGAIDNGESEMLRREAHAIKGGAANLTAMTLSNTALALEMIGKSGTMDKAREAMENMQKAFDALKAELTQCGLSR